MHKQAVVAHQEPGQHNHRDQQEVHRNPSAFNPRKSDRPTCVKPEAALV
jgi:hypothetical protein